MLENAVEKLQATSLGQSGLIGASETDNEDDDDEDDWLAKRTTLLGSPG